MFGQPSDSKELDFEFSLEDLETIKVIGKGSGGVVQLVRHKWVGTLFALKVMLPAKPNFFLSVFGLAYTTIKYYHIIITFNSKLYMVSCHMK